MIVKWKTEKRFPCAQIERVECVSETKKTVTVRLPRRREDGTVTHDEVRRDKSTAYETYHDSWQDAHDFLMDRATQQLNIARRRLQEAQSFFGNVKGMKPPKQ